MHFRPNRQVRKEEGEVVEEAQALLKGTVATSVDVYWLRRPPWVYVNELAHADGATLGRLAQRQTAFHPASWNYARASWLVRFSGSRLRDDLWSRSKEPSWPWNSSSSTRRSRKSWRRAC